MSPLLVAVLGAIVPSLAYVVARIARPGVAKSSAGGRAPVFEAYRFRTPAEGGSADRWVDMPCVGSVETFEDAAALLPDSGGQVETPDGAIHTLLPEGDDYLEADQARRKAVRVAIDTNRAIPLDDEPPK